jgi:pyridoxamine 5'-phosphate oxidase
MNKISDLRQNYTKNNLSKEKVNKNPFSQFDIWFDDALKSGTIEPNIFTLATCGLDLKPKARILLLKSFDEVGFVFYTNYNSNKAVEIAQNPNVSMTFLWLVHERQVRINGSIEKVSRTESEEYFHSRPRESQLGAWVSPQSTPIESREYLDNKLNEIEEQYKNTEIIPLPEFWGGYRVIPSEIEFWQGRPNRLHDRIRFTKTNNTWKIERLAP